MSTEYFKALKKFSKNEPYILGRNFEYAVMRKLRKLGYYCVRKFGSKGHEDIIAFRDGRILMIQAKWSRNRETKPESFDLKGLVKLAERYGAYAIFAGVHKQKRNKMYFKVWLMGRWVNAKLD